MVKRVLRCRGSLFTKLAAAAEQVVS